MSAAKVNNQNESNVTYNPSGRSFSGWLGGKSQLARTIIELMPEHRYYCEVFAGAAWVLFKKTPSYGETINDINGDLINLYRVFKYHPDALVKEFETQLICRDEFLRARSEESKSLTDIQRAARFYYLLRTCYGARIHNPSFSSHTIRPGNLKLGEDLREFLQTIHQRLQRVTIENLSYDHLILQKDHKDMLFYLDPPYYQCEKYYGNDIFSRDDFIKLRDILKNIEGKFILSLNDVPQVREIFADFYFIEKKIRWSVNATSTNEQLGNELIITNFAPK
ncbi:MULTISPECIES: DNA adenine methylase [unclassified Acinetobacter]|uniref:DNA adenine methylase n=1 Tax=unclassified Acinetobacter TaxID=196816 RepID=UPI0022AC5B93|nr:MULTISPECIES: DNA adenine methylase [unclassified Acinetobacter]WAU72949.1 DNA adenine methylase [Acinetobacter sp. TR11]WAU76044.1 DNA adenine methylase [Acinetobacter sp. TR3]